MSNIHYDITHTVANSYVDRLHSPDAYVYAAEIFCPSCAVEALIAEGRLAPAARSERIDDMLNMLTEAEALEPWEEQDSEVLPQASSEWCNGSKTNGECGSCGITFRDLY